MASKVAIVLLVLAVAVAAQYDNHATTKKYCLQPGNCLNVVAITPRLQWELFCSCSCPSTTDPICLLPPTEDGLNICRGANPKFTYNARTRRCEKYTYGGCGGTANLFNTLEECEQRCRNNEGRLIPSTPISQGGICKLPLERGPCRAEFLRFGYVQGSCRRFPYSGCGGNANNFQTLFECETSCSKTSRGIPSGEEK